MSKVLQCLLFYGALFVGYLLYRIIKSKKVLIHKETSSKDIKELKNKVEKISISFLQKVVPFDDIFNKPHALDKEENIWILTKVSAIVYRMHKIWGGGFYITEKNLSSAIDNFTVTQLCIHDSLGFFAVSTAQGKVLYFKNEFYENTELGQTNCVYTLIDNMEHHFSSIVGIGYAASLRLFAICYQDGKMRLFDVRNDKALKELRTYQLGSKNLKAFCITEVDLLLATLNDDYEEQMWNIPKDNIAKCISTAQLKQFFDLEHKLCLNSTIIEEGLSCFYYFAIDNSLDKKIELYTYRDSSYKCILTIPYEGKITCSAFCQKQKFFAFYQKGGENEGVNIWDIDNAFLGGCFTPADKNQQHPIQMCIKGDKVFCLYEDGLMDMWYCQADRQKIASETLEKIVNALPYNFKIEFLKQFCIYLDDRTANNHNILVGIASKGLPKKDIEAELMMLQLLNPEWIGKQI